MLGLIPDGHLDTARDLVDDFSYMLRQYGHIPNGARTYYLSRSQPPVFYLMVGLLAPDPARAWSSHLQELEREYAYWMAGAAGLRPGMARSNVVAMPDGSLLNRYWDAADTPRDESYRNDVLIARASHRPAAQVYRDIRAAAESGWDFSSRWLGRPTTSHHHRTTDHRADRSQQPSLRPGARDLERLRGAPRIRVRADLRRARPPPQTGNRPLSLGRQGGVTSWITTGGSERRTGELSAATLYPLFTGVADLDQADAVGAVTQMRLLESRAGSSRPTSPPGSSGTRRTAGRRCSGSRSWDCRRYDQPALAHEIARRWLATVQRVFDNTGKLVEKYDVEHTLPGGGGEYPLQDGFGWTNGVTRATAWALP